MAVAPPQTHSIDAVLASDPKDFDVVGAYKMHLGRSDVSMPVAALLSLSDLIVQSKISTMFELMEAVNAAVNSLKQSFSNNVSLAAGCDVFVKFLSSIRDTSDFDRFKQDVMLAVKEYADTAALIKETIADQVNTFIKDDSVILAHAYSRVVVHALIVAHKKGKRLSVYVTETRPRGLGLKTYDVLTNAGIPCTVILDSAVAYTMDKVDLVLLGTEAVVESGGIVNAVGSCQVAIIAKTFNRPVYVLAESYKFTRLFPLSQYDLPTHNDEILSFPSLVPTSPLNSAILSPLARELPRNEPNAWPLDCIMNADQLRRNPEVDYTFPTYISLVVSDAGILTPEGISSYLVTMALRSEPDAS